MKKEKFNELALWIILFLIMLSVIIVKPINNLDELWNYNFAKNIAEGLVPYKDFNILLMPLCPAICGLFLKIIANELIVMRFLGATLGASIFLLVFKIFKQLHVKTEMSTIFSFALVYLVLDYICIDYNFATLLITLLICYFEIKSYNETKDISQLSIKKNIMLGFLAGNAILLKQTSGLFICIVLLGHRMLFMKGKIELKRFFKNCGYQIIGILIPISIFLFYLAINHAIKDFINYTIKGISDFKNIIPYSNLLQPSLIGALSILVPVTSIHTWIRTVVMNREKPLYLVMVYGMAIFVIVFPISDKIHFLIGSIPCILIMLYRIYQIMKWIKNKLLKIDKLNQILLSFTVAMTLLFSIYFLANHFYLYYLMKDNYSSLKHYHYIPIEQDEEDKIIEVNEYLKSHKDVKILDATAVVYKLPMDFYEKHYDLLLKGNLGLHGDKKIIHEIAENNHTKYLILKSQYKKNWQTPMNIIHYVLENKTKIGEISVFDIYK